MSVHRGTRLGPYEIVAPIGAGGMGEVWKARDTRLDRSVAIKVLPSDFAANAQLKLRFEREAKTISQLEHPNICRLYDVGEAEADRENPSDSKLPDRPLSYLVMELLDGESLADRIARGPLPLRDVLVFGAEIAGALHRAHVAGVVHRDLKPGNIMITKSGAKLLDFGLAKSASAVVGIDGATMQKPLTQEGTILGTFQYMAPEQLEGEEADVRTDIFALGAVLYEMATGKRAFDGKTKTSLIAAIVGGTPRPMSEVQPLAPRGLDHIIAKCLEKDPDARWQSAHDVAAELRWVGEAPDTASTATAERRARMRERIGWMAALALVAAAAAAAFFLPRRPAQVVTASITTPLHAPFMFFNQAALSPDGRMLVFVAQGGASSLWLRPIDRDEPRELPSTDGAVQPFWSPDSKSVGFFADGKLKRIFVAGGPPQVVCSAPAPRGGSWSREDVIIFASGDIGSIFQVPASGGQSRQVTHLGPKEEAHRWPVFLPDGEHFVFLGDATRTEDHHIKVGTLSDGSARDLFQGVTQAQYVEPGTLLFVRAGSLLAQDFDARRLALSGAPRVLAEHVTSDFDNHHFQFAASNAGSLVYRSARPDVQLQWVDRSGRFLARVGEPRVYRSWRVAPDDRRVLAAERDADGRPADIWMIDPSRSTTTRVTFDPAGAADPVWSPDGSKMAFDSMRDGATDVYLAEIARPSAPERLTAPNTAYEVLTFDWSHDRDSLIVGTSEGNRTSLAICSIRDKTIRPYLSGPFSIVDAALSPDGRWLAYSSNESGRQEIYVEQFPSHAGRRQVSNGGGFIPRWRGDSRELFFVHYVNTAGILSSLDMTKDDSNPQPLFDLEGASYEPASDGQRFLVGTPVDARVPLKYVSNWMAGTK